MKEETNLMNKDYLENTTIKMDNEASDYSVSNKHTIKQYMIKLKTNFAYRKWVNIINKHSLTTNNMKLLDVGSGGGLLLNYFSEKLPTISLNGFEADPRLVKESQSLLKGKAKIYLGNAEKLFFEENYFDIVISLHMIEHLHRPELFIESVYKILVNNGILILSTPNPSGLGAKVMGKQWMGYRYDHVSLKSTNEWIGILKKKGFEIIESGSTFLSGIPIFNIFPFSVINWIILLIFGYFKWNEGEAIILVAKKVKQN